MQISNIFSISSIWSSYAKETVFSKYNSGCNSRSPLSRRVEVVGARKNGRARGRHACAHYSQAPATQAITHVMTISLSVKAFTTACN